MRKLTFAMNLSVDGIRYPRPIHRRSNEIGAADACCERLGLAALRGVLVVLWRAGLGVHKALALDEPDLVARREPGGRARTA